MEYRGIQGILLITCSCVGVAIYIRIISKHSVKKDIHFLFILLVIEVALRCALHAVFVIMREMLNGVKHTDWKKMSELGIDEKIKFRGNPYANTWNGFEC